MTALYNLLNRIDTNRFEIDIFPILDDGPNKNRFFNCNVLESNELLEDMLRRYKFSMNIHSLRAFIIKSLNRLTRKGFSSLVYRYVGKKLLRSAKYDAVVAWTECEPTTFVSHIPHSNKVAWVHCDYALGNHTEEENAAYKRLNRIICVSNACKTVFLSFFPELEKRVVVLYNILDTKSIIEKSKEPINDFHKREGCFTIISYGRIASSKRFPYIPGFAKIVRDAGIPFHWYILGPNQHPDELERIQTNIVKYGVQDCVEYFGARVNPYPYIKKADFVVNTSKSEALPYSIFEPKVLGVPIINADIPPAHEILENGKEGIIVPFNEIPNAIISFCKDASLRARIREYNNHFVYDDQAAVRGFERLFEKE